LKITEEFVLCSDVVCPKRFNLRSTQSGACAEQKLLAYPDPGGANLNPGGADLNPRVADLNPRVPDHYTPSVVYAKKRKETTEETHRVLMPFHEIK
jgi:hypothetical protein